MTTTEYIEKMMRDKNSRKLSKLSEDGITEIIKKTDKNVWNSMEDLFGNLFTNFHNIIHHLENTNISEDHKESLNEELAKNISTILTLKEYFTDAKHRS